MRKGFKPPTESFVTGCKGTPPLQHRLPTMGTIQTNLVSPLGPSPCPVLARTDVHSHLGLTLAPRKALKATWHQLTGCGWLAETLNSQRGLQISEMSAALCAHSQRHEGLGRARWNLPSVAQLPPLCLPGSGRASGSSTLTSRSARASGKAKLKKRLALAHLRNISAVFVLGINTPLIN